MKIELGTAIVEQIRNVLTAIDQEESAVAAKIVELEAQGYRIVEYGQVSLGDEPLKMECNDWRTGEIIWSGSDPDAAPSDGWYNIDFIRHEVDHPDTIKANGIPDWLASAVEEITTAHEDEFRKLIERQARTGQPTHQKTATPTILKTHHHQ